MNKDLNILLNNKFEDEMNKKLENLDEIDRKIICMWLGLDGNNQINKNEISEILGLSLAEVEEKISIVLRELRKPVDNFDEVKESLDLCDVVNPNIKLLNKKERTLLSMLYGYIDTEPKTIEYIANIFSESVEQINLDIETAKQKLKRGV